MSFNAYHMKVIFSRDSLMERGGGVSITVFADQEPCVRDFTTRCDRRISLWNLSHTALDQRTLKIENPPGGGVFFQSTLQYAMGWLRLVGFLKLYGSSAKEPYKRDDFLQRDL